ncbi:glucose-6-phosphate dehydrogenase [Sphingomonas aerolata]|uniref:Glucose-6-phosphate 1-dehydrogenase n=1 Tax=Sphingomonas aerolata TaxID=185951 RepID=A0A2T4YTC6_9SPHN|nr:glucose-6-phosphate dehydrogenase [Sphingomonas aerolata]PTM47070.1 glucose-6-phosphate 1-dehydrogenase [Sphingomonas aerolata]
MTGAIHPAPPTTLVIFGAMGDLTRRLLMPALTNMTRLGMIGEDFSVLGIGIEPGDDDTLRTALATFRASAPAAHASPEQEAAWDRLQARVQYMQGDFTQDDVYARLSDRLSGNAAFYLAVPARFFGDIVDRLAANGLTHESKSAFRRIAIEKPFGHDLASAQALNARILSHVAETQIYRIDHFLGKETVQNIMTARFANMMIERVWNADCIAHVQITAAETVDVGTRGAFYDATGALRDMVPNHLFQLLAMVAMEPPASFDAEAIRNEKGKVLKAVRAYSPAKARRNGVRGAYGAGTIGERAVPAFTASPDIAPDSTTETYVALKLMVDTWRWAGVPFYLRTGKAMEIRDTEVVITFKPVPFAQFHATAAEKLPPNRLIIQIQPDEGLSMDINIKRPGLEVDTAPIALDFRYADSFDIGAMTGYESLIHDLFAGDQTLFQRADAIEAGWAAVQPFLDAWASEGAPDTYAAGTTGPAAADELLARDGFAWHTLDPAKT